LHWQQPSTLALTFASQCLKNDQNLKHAESHAAEIMFGEIPIVFECSRKLTFSWLKNTLQQSAKQLTKQILMSVILRRDEIRRAVLRSCIASENHAGLPDCIMK
jgi:hypothetical protein